MPEYEVVQLRTTGLKGRACTQSMHASNATDTVLIQSPKRVRITSLMLGARKKNTSLELGLALLRTLPRSRSKYYNERIDAQSRSES